MSKTITKKILSQYFKDVKSGKKTFELRKDEDDIEVGDIVVLREWDKTSGYTGKEVRRVVSYVLRDCEEYGLMPGHCIFGWQNCR